MISMNVFVTKADGSRQVFDRNKVKKTCLRMGANNVIAEEVVKEVESNLYDGIQTDKILELTLSFLHKYKPNLRHRLDLKKGLSLMNSKPEFELFVQHLLAESGYNVSSNRIVKGRCGDHEVDAIAEIDGITYFVEAKHHSNYHTPTGLDESRIARAILEDIIEGFELGINDLGIKQAMIITNTRYSEHARRYGACRNILQIGWSSPPDHSLQDLIEENKLYPLTCIKNLRKWTRKRLVNNGIIVMKQLLEDQPKIISRKTGISKKIIGNLINKSKITINSINY
jgi:hypothetical protein